MQIIAEKLVAFGCLNSQALHRYSFLVHSFFLQIRSLKILVLPTPPLL